MLAAAGYYANVGRTAKGIDSTTQKAIDQMDKMNRSMEKMVNESQSPSVSSPSTLDPNSLEAQAHREMERLQREHGVRTPPLGPDGNIHLQSGGTLSPEDYQRARQTLQNP